MPAAKTAWLMGKSEAERASLIGLGVNADFSAVTLHHALRQVQAVSRSAPPGLVELQPEVEDLPGVSWIDPDSVVANAEADHVSILSAFDGDHSLTFCAVVEEERIRDQRADC